MENLKFHVLGEFATCIFSLILCYNVLSTYSHDNRRHRLFLYAGISSLINPLSDIASIFCISYFQSIPLWVCTAVSTLYFLTLICVPFCITLYVFSVIFPYKRNNLHTDIYVHLVLFAYWAIVLINLKTGWIFHYDPVLGYVKGSFKYITYITMLIFFGFIIEMVISNRKVLAKRLFVVFMLLPLVCGLIMVIQFFNPTMVMTGTASFAALLLTYMTIQSDLLDYDFVTGLLSSRKLSKHVTDSNEDGVLYVIEIDNILQFQNFLNIYDYNNLLMDFGRQLSKLFGRKVYHLTNGRFAALCSTIEQMENNHKVIADYIKTIDLQKNKFLFSIEFSSVALQLPAGEKNYASISDLINSLLKDVKQDSKNNLRICDEEFLLKMEREKEIAKILFRELNKDSQQFQVFFQPIFSIKDGSFTHMEALSRLNETELGNISPGEFVPIAESKGLIELMGNTVLEKVCKFISDNKDMNLSASVNFSVYQMTNPGFVESVLALISKYDISPSSIIAEITESIFIDDFNLVRENMKKLADAGIEFYLDDFGTGYSNLSNVLVLPFSTIKMDRTLMLTMEKGKKYADLFTNLVSTFKDAGLQVLVEGIETKNQNDMVTTAGVDYIQGYLYSKPINSHDCLELFKN